MKNRDYTHNPLLLSEPRGDGVRIKPDACSDALADALAYKFGYRDADSRAAVTRYAAEAHKFSLVGSGALEKPACKLLVINGMEDSIFPIEDSIVVAIQGKNKDLILGGDRRHMGNPGAEEIVYEWIDSAVVRKP